MTCATPSEQRCTSGTPGQRMAHGVKNVKHIKDDEIFNFDPKRRRLPLRRPIG